MKHFVTGSDRRQCNNVLTVNARVLLCTGQHGNTGDTIMARTAEQIERIVELRTNAADSALMNRRMTQAAYDLHMRALNRWADQQFRKAEAA